MRKYIVTEDQLRDANVLSFEENQPVIKNGNGETSPIIKLPEDSTFYQLTFFDTKENNRFVYLNGTSFTSIKRAEKEYDLIKAQERLKESKLCIYSTRTKWAIEAIKNKKRRIIKHLS